MILIDYEKREWIDGRNEKIERYVRKIDQMQNEREKEGRPLSDFEINRKERRIPA